MAPRPKDSGTVLYATPRTPVHAIIIGCLFGSFLTVALLVFISTLLRKPTPGGLVLTGGITLGIALLGIFVTKAAYVGFVVTTEGLTSINNVRTHHVPWPEVARIDPCTQIWFLGATEVHTTAGQVIRAGFTGVRYIYFRGEPVPAPVPGGLCFTYPTLVARDAHQRYLRGEFARRR